MKIPTPPTKYVTAQKEFIQLMERRDSSGRKRQLEKEMEQVFMKAWKLAPDVRRKAARLRHALLPNDASCKSGLDHCTYYYSIENAAPAIVSQPYGDYAEELTNSLALGLWSSPEVILAPDWGFYYPGKAQLHIIFFPHGYAEALAGLKRTLR